MNFARRKGFKTYLDKPDKNEIVYLGNMFDEIGFGFVAIETLPQTKK